VTDLPLYEFGDIQVDLRRMTLSRAGIGVTIEPKAFDVLRYLVEHRDRLVTKDELLDTIWKGTFVTPNVLTRAVVQLRSALGDAADHPRFIETVPKRGYRFIAAVRTRVPAHEEEADSSAADVSPVRRPVLAGLVVAVTVIVVATVALTWVRRPATRVPTVVAVPQRLTTRMGNDTLPAVAPDGRAVAYVSDRSGKLEIYVVGFAPGSREIAITHDGGQNVGPAWSPDGSWLAFHSQARGGIWIVPSTGGTPRQIADTGSEPAWNHDGSRLVFASGEGGMATQSVIWTVKTDGSDRRPLSALGAPAGGHHEPSWSHDGRFVAFTVWTNGGTHIWIVPASGDQPPRQIVSELSRTPVFGPDSRTLYWAGLGPTPETSVSDQVRGVPLNGSGAPSGESFTVVPWLAGRINGLSIGSDGTLAFGLQTSDMNLWALDVMADGSSGEPVRLTDDVIRDTTPDYSSTGRIAYVQIAGGAYSAWVMNDDGSNREPLASAPAHDPQWNGDGSQVLIRTTGQADTAALAWVDLNTRRLTPTAISGIPTGQFVSPRLSPDSHDVAFHVIESSGAMNVWTRALDGRSQRRLTSDPESISFPVWSPDGRWLAVEIKRGEHTHVGVISSDGGPLQQLTNDGGQSWPHTWSPDGEWIVFAGERGGVWNVYEVSRRTKATRALTHFTSSSGYVRYPSWSPRGHRISFERAIESSGIWVARIRAR
jgi:Tol biopolymer transport system component/DNA-binding winged helix-turn-helix (wHTH) protein